MAERGVINLLIAGFGNAVLENRLSSLNGNAHIKYYGKVEYQQGLNIMYNSDIIDAMYSKILPNHVYAAPNKYYEAMFLGKAIFTTDGTFVGNKVIKNGIGYVSGETEDDILKAINSLHLEDIKKKGEKANYLWTSTYSSFTRDFLSINYKKIIEQ